MEKKRKIDDVFKSELGSYTETPPPAVWDALEDRLDAAPKPRGMLTRIGIAGLLCLFLAASLWMATRNRGNNGQADQQAPVTSNTARDNNNTSNNALSTETGNENKSDGTPDATAANAPEHNTTSATATPTTGPNRVSNIKPVVYNSTGAPVAVNANAVVDGTYKKGDDQNNGVKKDRNRKQTKPGSRKQSKLTNHNKIARTTSYVVAEENEPDRKDDQNNFNTIGPNHNTTAVNDNNTKQEQTTQTDNNTTNEKDTKKEEETKQQPNKTDNPLRLAPNDVPKPRKKRPTFDRFEAGVKAGYEQGFNNDAAQKGVLATFAQYKLSKKFGIMLQPTVKYSNVSSRQIGDGTPYYQVNDDTMILKSASSTSIIDNSGNIVGTLYQSNYLYQQSHDSIVKSNWTGGKYFEVEMPVLAKYYASEKFSLYGGVNIVYSTLTGLKERTYTERNITRFTEFDIKGETPPVAPVRPNYTYTGAPYSQYTGPKYPALTNSTFRLGYMFGFSWEFEERWLIDALVQQTFIKPNVQEGYNTYTPLSTPYIRLSLGYKIIK